MTARPATRLRAVLGATVLALPVVLLAVPGPAGAVPDACSGAPHDINGDGFADVAVGEPNGGPNGGGRVHVLYGTANGLATAATGDAPNDQIFGQGVGGLSGVDNAGDGFGASTLVEDMNADGCADLVVGIPGNNRGIGAVAVLFGSTTGITTDGSQFLDAGRLKAEMQGTPGESLGYALAAGDFDADGVNDLAISIPFAQQNTGNVDRGAVHVVFGTTRGFPSPRTEETYRQGRLGVPGTPEDGDAFGLAIAAGDVTGDGIDDLVVGVPGENRAAGLVQVLVGRPLQGLRAGRVLSQNTAGVPGAAEAGDNFGFALAVGDVNGDGDGDIVVGAPGENAGRGVVDALMSDASGAVTGAGAQQWWQESPGVDGIAGGGDLFGASVAVDRLDGDAFADVAVGAPLDAVGSVARAGSVTLLRGSATGLSVAGYGGSRLTQATAGVAGSPERGDRFGDSVATSAVQGRDVANLLVAASGENVGGVVDAGVSVTFAAGTAGPSGTGSQTLGADSPGVAGTARRTALWGFGLD